MYDPHREFDAVVNGIARARMPVSGDQLKALRDGYSYVRAMLSRLGADSSLRVRENDVATWVAQNRREDNEPSV